MRREGGSRLLLNVLGGGDLTYLMGSSAASFLRSFWVKARAESALTGRYECAV